MTDAELVRICSVLEEETRLDDEGVSLLVGRPEVLLVASSGVELDIWLLDGISVADDMERVNVELGSWLALVTGLDEI